MNDSCAVLFSGGYDSTLAAALAAERFRRVYLVTYKRLGIFKTDRVSVAAGRLKEVYPDVRFESSLIGIDKFYKEICYENYPANVIKFGFMVLTFCGLCKLAMHWRTMIFCMENEVSNVYDGAVAGSKVFPGQNKDIMLDRMKRLYLSYGINYSTPVYNNRKGDTKQEIHKRDLLYSDREEGKEKTPPRSQPVCIDNLLFSRFVDYYLGIHTWEEYVDGLSRFYAAKMDYIKERMKT
ncbi:MAG: hypothetical protein DRP85_04305 [Candidatus Makaraimicrobium thalassicum]|nr:MAG: hypothetical protein DRP85_04305 [Candidatus Omnitrophota bacterium]